MKAVGNLTEVPRGLVDVVTRGVEAVVPGCVHSDLIRAGVIRDPRVGFAEREQFWVGKTDWRYECEFEAAKDLFERERLDLVCEGLDTIAVVELNGKIVGAAANMFHPHRFDVRGVVRRGGNTLAVTFSSPLRHVRAEEARLGARPVNGDWDPYVFIRKAAYNFGWDWAPKTPTCGMWKSICVEAWSGVRVAGVRPLVRRADETRWNIELSLDLEWSRSGTLPVSMWAGLGSNLYGASSDEEQASAVVRPDQESAVLSMSIENPELWWPLGMGAQPLYEISVHNETADESLLWIGRIGFRDVRLRRAIDDGGSEFTFVVNEQPVFCKGANWVPDSLFPSEMRRERYRERVGQAAAANMNMLRVWGGGYYEDEAFYGACDELGILVWQDFMFACAMYPEEAPYPALIEAEARHQITRLSAHPSVALWCGGNECVWAYESWGNAPGERPWKERVGEKSWGRGYYFELLPRLVKELDPTRAYWANSPWSGSDAVRANDVTHGDRHTWDVRVEGYRRVVPRFCSEFGHQSPANVETLEKVMGPGELVVGSEGLEHRQRATGGTARHIDEELMRRYGAAKDFREWHARAQEVQALAMTIGIEAMAASRPRCMGALIWQLNDCWPGFSWSLIDSEGRPKPAYYAVKEAFGKIEP